VKWPKLHFCVKFLFDVADQKLLKSVNVLRSYSKNISGTFLWTKVYFSFAKSRRKIETQTDTRSKKNRQTDGEHNLVCEKQSLYKNRFS